MARILCVDDEASVGVVLEHVLNRLGHEPVITTDPEEALKLVSTKAVDLILADYQMPRMTGLDLARELEKEGLRVPVIIMTAFSSIDHAVVSIRSGAIDYVTKPINAARMEVAINHALSFRDLQRENEKIRQELNSLKVGRVIVGQSPVIRQVLDMVATVAPTKAAVLLEGESGTGKELLARALHDLSNRSSGPFVTVNCAAMPEGLIESVLFGHEKGAFTGATGRVQGAFERAHSGTLLLDEISEMRLDLQAKLLRAIQEQEFERVGGTQSVRVDVRLVATTNRSLLAEVEAGRFRSDLYYRLNVVPMRSPPLRERTDDIPLLVHHFIKISANDVGVAPPEISPEALDLLKRHDWPGNIRELSHTIERAVIFSGGKKLTPQSFESLKTGHVNQAPARVVSHSPGPEPVETPCCGEDQEVVLDLATLERATIARALEATGGHRSKAAQLLGISERTLRNKLNPRPVDV